MSVIPLQRECCEKSRKAIVLKFDDQSHKKNDDEMGVAVSAFSDHSNNE
jgi:hypothetical protein